MKLKEGIKMSSQYNYDARLSGLNIDKDTFNQRAHEVIENEKQNTDESVFSSKENFVEHYEEKILGSNNEISLDDFTQNAIEKGYLEEDESEIFARLTDGEMGDRILNKDEVTALLGAVYDGAREAQKGDDGIYEKVTVQAWGTGVDDCLSRIIDNHVDGIELYSEEYNEYLSELCRINGIEDPNVAWGEIKLPKMKRDENNEILKDQNGNIQFYSEDELLALKNESENT